MELPTAFINNMEVPNSNTEEKKDSVEDVRSFESPRELFIENQNDSQDEAKLNDSFFDDLNEEDEDMKRIMEQVNQITDNERNTLFGPEPSDNEEPETDNKVDQEKVENDIKFASESGKELETPTQELPQTVITTGEDANVKEENSASDSPFDIEASPVENEIIVPTPQQPSPILEDKSSKVQNNIFQEINQQPDEENASSQNYETFKNSKNSLTQKSIKSLEPSANQIKIIKKDESSDSLKRHYTQTETEIINPDWDPRAEFTDPESARDEEDEGPSSQINSYPNAWRGSPSELKLSDVNLNGSNKATTKTDLDRESARFYLRKTSLAASEKPKREASAISSGSERCPERNRDYVKIPGIDIENQELIRASRARMLMLEMEESTIREEKDDLYSFERDSFDNISDELMRDLGIGQSDSKSKDVYFEHSAERDHEQYGNPIYQICNEENDQVLKNAERPLLHASGPRNNPKDGFIGKLSNFSNKLKQSLNFKQKNPLSGRKHRKKVSSRKEKFDSQIRIVDFEEAKANNAHKFRLKNVKDHHNQNDEHIQIRDLANSENQSNSSFLERSSSILFNSDSSDHSDGEYQPERRQYSIFKDFCKNVFPIFDIFFRVFGVVLLWVFALLAHFKRSSHPYSFEYNDFMLILFVSFLVLIGVQNCSVAFLPCQKTLVFPLLITLFQLFFLCSTRKHHTSGFLFTNTSGNSHITLKIAEIFFSVVFLPNITFILFCMAIMVIWAVIYLMFSVLSAFGWVQFNNVARVPPAHRQVEEHARQFKEKYMSRLKGRFYGETNDNDELIELRSAPDLKRNLFAEFEDPEFKLLKVDDQIANFKIQKGEKLINRELGEHIAGKIESSENKHIIVVNASNEQKINIQNPFDENEEESEQQDSADHNPQIQSMHHSMFTMLGQTGLINRSENTAFQNEKSFKSTRFETKDDFFSSFDDPNLPQAKKKEFTVSKEQILSMFESHHFKTSRPISLRKNRKHLLISKRKPEINDEIQNEQIHSGSKNLNIKNPNPPQIGQHTCCHPKTYAQSERSMCLEDMKALAIENREKPDPTGFNEIFDNKVARIEELNILHKHHNKQSKHALKRSPKAPANPFGPFSGSQYEQDMCSICFTSFNQMSFVVQMPSCGHLFHHNCIKMWLDKNPICPICRFNVFTFFEGKDRIQNDVDNNQEDREREED